MMDVIGAVHPVLLAAVALAFLALALALWWSGDGRRAPDAFTLLGLDPRSGPRSGPRRPRATPVDLGRPISDEAAWSRIMAVSRDAQYRRAVETVRARYRVVANPMLLPNALQATMERWDLGFREAMIRVAEDDGLFER